MNGCWRGCRAPLLPALVLTTGIAVSGIGRAQEPFTQIDRAQVDILQDEPGAEEPRGRIAVGYQIQHTKGLILNNGDVQGATTTDAQLAYLAVDYRVDDHWEAHAELPFIRKRSNGGPGAHRTDLLDPPHPEAQFLDDGRYHGTLQDWVLGLSYHGYWRRFEVEPHLVATIPSHDYSHFGNAAIGQNLWRVKLGVDLTRRLHASNFYYSLGYSYEVWERVDGISLDKQHFRASAGYFFTPQLSTWAFANARVGQGRNTNDFLPGDRSSEAWYQHDRTSEHHYVLGGIGARYRINDRYSLSATAARMLWGRNVHDLKYACNVELSRSF